MSKENIDTQLAKRIAADDRGAEQELFLRFEKQIKYMVYIRLKTKVSREDVEDIVAEIKHAVLTSLRKGGFDPEKGKTLSAYIAGIVYKIVCQYFRKQDKDKDIQPGLLHSVPENMPTILDGMISLERSRKLKKLLGRLHPKYQEVLVLKFYEQLGTAEIAERLNLERRRVSERLNYAVKKLTELCGRNDSL